MVLLGNRTIEKSIAAVKCPEKLFENVCALLQGRLGGSKVGKPYVLLYCPLPRSGFFLMVICALE
jgi:hypothetical protein